MFFQFNDHNRYDVINDLIQKRGYKSYLEIGVASGECFNNVYIDSKVGVDPDPNSAATIKQTSDEFFNMISDDFKYDIIFIDGLHEAEQCYKDIVNATKHLNKGGMIICHDMNPLREAMVDYPGEMTDYCDSEGNPIYTWMGDVYKAFIKFRIEHREYSSCMLFDTDCGIGIIMEGVGTKVDCDLNKLSYYDWENNKQYLMNCISYDDFAKLFL